MNRPMRHVSLRVPRHDTARDGRVCVAPSLTGEWTCMCAVCFADFDSEVGYGQGQLYQRQPNGDWLLVGGFPPKD